MITFRAFYYNELTKAWSIESKQDEFRLPQHHIYFCNNVFHISTIVVNKFLHCALI